MTAVEFIRQEFLEKITNENYKKSFDQIIEQAKEMEKERIMNAVLYGFRQDSDGDDWQGDNYNAEKYYNTTFKSE